MLILVFYRPLAKLATLLGVIVVVYVVSILLGGRGWAERAFVQRFSWEGLPAFEMRGGLKAFWNVIDRNTSNSAEAHAHGFLPLSITSPYSDNAQGKKQHINTFLGERPRNPWLKPPFFSSVVRGNIDATGSTGTFVQDIEFVFEDPKSAWNDPFVRAAAHVDSYATFEKAYYREWASWFSEPLKWVKERFPGTIVGLYGRQPFNIDYWGVAEKTTEEIEKNHENDDLLWRYIDPYVDFYIAGIYVYYHLPDSIFYMAANVEQNVARSRKYGDRPVYAYEWLRFHDSNRIEGNRELDPYLVEAMAIIPYFSGARGVVLWGYEPQLMEGDGRPYERLPLYMKTLARVAKLSTQIGGGRLLIDESAHALWKAKRPLVRRIEIAADECVVMALNPWQDDYSNSNIEAACGAETHSLHLEGRHTTIALIKGSKITLH